jgi:NAD-dependent DNA ligase
LYWLCQKYENDNYFYNPITSDLQILQGICHGILADGIITDKEIYDLQNWLNENEHLNTYYPYDEIRSLIISVLSDNIIDEEERTILMAYFNQFVTIQDSDVKQTIKDKTVDVNISGLCTSEPDVNFEGKTFCITGVLQRGNRENLQRDIIKLGGIPTDTISKKTDYLIVGDNGNPAWAFSCYGRKVEKAINLRKDGHTIMLIHEFDFSDIIDDLL